VVAGDPIARERSSDQIESISSSISENGVLITKLFFSFAYCSTPTTMEKFMQRRNDFVLKRKRDTISEVEKKSSSTSHLLCSAMVYFDTIFVLL
jgi:hypothetical protein